jgi:hypothetical protein
MRRTVLCIAALAAIISACGSSNRPAGVASNSNGSSVSFGLYDISSSKTTSQTVSNTATAANVSTINAGGGGGGGRNEAPMPMESSAFRKASLDNAEKSQQSSLASDRKIIRNSELDLESDSPEQSQQKITSIAESKGGFVVESQQSSSDAKSASSDSVTMSVRVPADKFAEALEEIRKSASRIVTETVKGQDVTEEFIDIEAQLKAKKALESQFMEIMKRANTVEDALNVHTELADVRSEIERIEGRKRFLENQSELSTIKIRLQTPKVFAANSVGFLDRLSDSFGTGLDVAMNFVLGLITFVIGVIPFALFIGLPGFLIIRYFWKRQSRPKSISEIAEEEIKNG